MHYPYDRYGWCKPESDIGIDYKLLRFLLPCFSMKIRINITHNKLHI